MVQEHLVPQMLGTIDGRLKGHLVQGQLVQRVFGQNILEQLVFDIHIDVMHAHSHNKHLKAY